jgi:ferredoxin-fold anticodon binding domain-containing protein
MFSEDVLLKLKEDAHKYKGKMYDAICLKIYNELLSCDELRAVKVEQLQSSVKEAEKVYQTDQDALRSWGLERPPKRFKSLK